MPFLSDFTPNEHSKGGNLHGNILFYSTKTFFTDEMLLLQWCKKINRNTAFTAGIR
jgi:hypothetical protein